MAKPTARQKHRWGAMKDVLYENRPLALMTTLTILEEEECQTDEEHEKQRDSFADVDIEAQT